jgi:hypothetical protein
MPYEIFYEITSKGLSTLIQKEYFKKGYVWCGTGAGLWYPSREQHYYIGVAFNTKRLSCHQGTPSEYIKKRIKIFPAQMEFEF